MKHISITKASMSVLLLAGVALGGTMPAWGATLNDVFQVAERINEQARQSQARIDALTEETRELLNEYRTVLKEIEGLRVYNEQLERQIASQEDEMREISESTDQVTVIQRQITPLMQRMINALEQFVELDLPFLLDERHERIERLREMMGRADVAVSEKLSQVLQAFQIENEYGRTIEAYTAEITVEGEERIVDVLKVGRIALVYQTSDAEETGVYNEITEQWETLDESFTDPVRDGIRMARQQLAPGLMTMPVMGPESAQVSSPGPEGAE